MRLQNIGQIKLGLLCGNKRLKTFPSFGIFDLSQSNRTQHFEHFVLKQKIGILTNCVMCMRLIDTLSTRRILFFPYTFELDVSSDKSGATQSSGQRSRTFNMLTFSYRYMPLVSSGILVKKKKKIVLRTGASLTSSKNNSVLFFRNFFVSFTNS